MAIDEAPSRKHGSDLIDQYYWKPEQAPSWKHGRYLLSFYFRRACGEGAPAWNDGSGFMDGNPWMRGIDTIIETWQ